MATSNRSAQIKQALKILRRHQKPVPLATDRTVLDHLLFAACLENSLHEAADRAFTTLREQFYDWNEVRVSSIGELAESVKMLNDPEDAAVRIKRSLQSVFESLYSFDLEGLKKENIGQAVKKLQRLDGTTHFSVAFITQAALGGHSIPVNRGLLGAFVVLGIVSEAEAAKGCVPGLERAIPKTKGVEAGSVLHYLGVAFGRNRYSPALRKLLLEIDPHVKDSLPKRPAKTAEEPPSSGKSDRSAKGRKRAAKGAKSSAKKPTKKAAKKGAPKKAKDSSSRKLSKRKPR